METKKIIAIIDECVDQELLLKKVIAEIILPKVEAYVAATPNEIDNVVFEKIKDILAKLA